MTKAALTSCRMALIPLGFAPSGRVIRLVGFPGAVD